MTIRVCISGAASKWQTPQSPEYHFSSDPCFRVPPTGIPKPEPDEVPQAHRWRDRLAGFACAMVLAFGAGNMANASSSGGLDWNPDSPVSANMAGKPSGSGAELLPRMDDWLPAANISTGQQSASQLDGARQDGNGQAEERKVASSTILQKEPVTGDGQAATIPERVVLRENIATLERAIIEKEAEERISLQKAALVEEEIDILAPLVEGGHEPRSALIAARARHQQETGVAELAGLAASARRADMIGTQREIESAIANFRAAAAETLVEEQTKAAQLLARQNALRGKVRHADVRAPLSGTVSAVHVKTVGAVVQAGTMLAEIVPSEAEYLVRAQINPQDIADVQPGQVARISLAAYDPSRYGVVMGVVRRVASNTTQPENAMPFYETIIAIPEVAFTKSPDEPVITAGMPLQVDILGCKRTVMNYIMTPIQKSLATAFREK